MAAEGAVRSRSIFFRVDASSSIGTGHLMRSLALAQAWRQRGGSAVFLGRTDIPALVARIEAEGCRWVPVDDVAAGGDEATALGHWCLGGEGSSPWLVLDGYHFGPEYQQRLRELGCQVLVIDDMGHHARYHANILLNQNSHAVSLQYAADPDTVFLLGTRYALLRREFLAGRGAEKEIVDSARRILVTLGGADPENSTTRVLAALARLGRDDLAIKVVVGAANPYRTAVEDQAARLSSRWEILHGVGDMPALMMWADLCVAAAGSTCWELAYLGVPALLGIVADNQVAIAESLGIEGAFCNIGWFRECPVEDMARQIGALCASREQRQALSRRAQRLVDGHGGQRVVQLMEEMV